MEIKIVSNEVRHRAGRTLIQGIINLAVSDGCTAPTTGSGIASIATNALSSMRFLFAPGSYLAAYCALVEVDVDILREQIVKRMSSNPAETLFTPEQRANFRANHRAYSRVCDITRAVVKGPRPAPEVAA